MTGLAGARVAITGRFASMTRAEALVQLERSGAAYSSTVSPQTTLLVIGEDGWPLKADGRLTHKLLKARRLQRSGHEIEILREAAFLERLHGQPAAGDGQRLYSLLDLRKLLKISRERLAAWERAGLIVPAATAGGVRLFNFQQVTQVRSLAQMLDSGIRLQTIRRSLQQMRQWLPDVDESLGLLGHLRHDGRRIVVEAADGRRSEPSGQRLFDFDEGSALVLRFGASDDLFVVGVRHEEQGDWNAACAAYEQLLEQGGAEPDVLFNLGNVRYALGDVAGAAERFRQAVAADPSFSEAWLNLGNVLALAGQQRMALAALEHALLLDPQLSDAHYAIADLLEETGRVEEARPHWLAFLAAEAKGEWADHARSRLDASPA